jgi:hypothetical protein
MSQLEDISKCYLRVRGNPDLVAEFKANQEEGDEVFSFNAELPLEGDDDDPWELWGCQEAEDAQILEGMSVEWLVDDSIDEVEYSFYCRQYPPLNWLETVALKYHQLEFHLIWANEESGESGKVDFKGGLEIRHPEPDISDAEAAFKETYEEVFGEGAWQKRRDIIREEDGE